MQTSKPVRRFKNTPFIIQFIASLMSTDTSNTEGIFHMMPSQKSIKDDLVVRKRIKIEKDITGATETIKSIKVIYPFVLELESDDFQTEASPFDNGIDIYSYVLIRYQISFGFGMCIFYYHIYRIEGKQRPTLAQVVGLNAETCVLEIFKPINKSAKNYESIPAKSETFSRSAILCCNLSVKKEEIKKDGSENELKLRLLETPMETLKALNINWKK